MYSGKAKDVIELGQGRVRIKFRDSISAFDGVKKDDLTDKGKTNCKISAKLFAVLEKYGLPTHYLEQDGENALICKKVKIFPVEVVCRNIAAGSFCRRYGVEEGFTFSKPIIEFFVKDDAHHDPLIDESVAIVMNLITQKEALFLRNLTIAVNTILTSIFDSIGLTLVDFKLEFGKTDDGQIVIADEISPDTMRLWEKETGEIKDKDRYRKDLGDVISHYKDIYKRLLELKELPRISFRTLAKVDIQLKDAVLDSAGEVTLRSLKRLGLNIVSNVRLGKIAKIEFTIPPSSNLYATIQQISQDILSNPLIENYDIDFKVSSVQDI